MRGRVGRPIDPERVLELLREGCYVWQIAARLKVADQRVYAILRYLAAVGRIARGKPRWLVLDKPTEADLR